MNDSDALTAEFESTIDEFERTYAAHEAEMQVFQELADGTKRAGGYDHTAVAYRSGMAGRGGG